MWAIWFLSQLPCNCRIKAAIANKLPCNDKILFTQSAVHNVLTPELTPHPAKVLGEAVCQQGESLHHQPCAWAARAPHASLLELKESEVAVVSSSW